MKRTQKAVFLDRDGVLNRSIVIEGKPFAPTRFEDFELLPKVHEATKLLVEGGFKLIVVTNQPDLATGKVEREVVQLMHKKLMEELPLTSIKVCPHVAADGCLCRKPKAGMLTTAAHEYDIDLTQSFMVGDRWRDIEAGTVVGCKTILVLGEFKESVPCSPTWTANSLFEASRTIMSLSPPGGC